MAIAREQPKCPYCGEGYKSTHSNMGKNFVGDTFISWDISGHNKICKHHPLNKSFLNNKNQIKMKQVKSKFICDSVNHLAYGHRTTSAKQAKLSAVYAGDKNAEDNQFSNATPCGAIDITVTNPDTMDFIQPGKKYYVYFEECENQD